MIMDSRAEILQIVESVSREKGVSKSDLVDAMERAIKTAALKKYGAERDNIIAQIDQNTGKISLFRVCKVVNSVEDLFLETSLDEAISVDPAIKIGDEVKLPLPPIELGRVAAQIAKQVIVQKVDEIERLRQYEDYKDRKGEILTGVVKRVEFNNVIVDIGRGEAILHRNQQIRGEVFRVGDRIKAYVQDVRLVQKGQQIILSRTDNGFLSKLLEMEVQEIYDNLVEIRAIVREPGSKAKVAVSAKDTSVDPVGACIGVRGSRIINITNELAGEKIDIINWDSNLAQFIINAMTPAEITKIVVDESSNRVEAVVAKDQLSIAIGKKGQNVSLASRITGWRIDIVDEEQESKLRAEEFTSRTALFEETLGIEKVKAQLLASGGFASLEQIVHSEDHLLEAIEGFDKESIAELKNRAITYVEQEEENVILMLEKLGVEQELLDILDLPAQYILKLAESGVKTIEDLTEITLSEFRDLVPKNIMTEDNIKSLLNFAKEKEQESVDELSSDEK